MGEAEDYVKLFLLWLLSTAVVRLVVGKTRRRWRRCGSPPGPGWFPVIGHLHLISSLPHRSFDTLSRRYGPMMQIFLGSVRCVVVSCPEAAKEFLKTNQQSFSNRFVSEAVHRLSYGSKGFLFAPYGRYWKFMKKICMSQLLGARTLHQLLHVRQEETLRFLRVLKAKGEAREGVDVGGELMTLTNSVISRMLLNRTSCEGNEEKMEDVRKMVEDTAELAGKFNVADFIWFCKGLDLQRMNKRLREILERFDEMMERVMKEHEEERNNENNNNNKVRDLLDILLDIHQDDTMEIKLSRDNVKAFILDIFMAGTDTSAITMEWAMAELINNPHAMEKAREEIEVVTENNKRLIQESDIPNLPYLQAIVKETLRIHPTSPFIGREASENCNVLGYDIPAKSLLFVNLWSMGRDPKLWDNPLEFRPERFMGEKENHNHDINDDTNNNKKVFDDVRGQNFQLMPFGTGTRVCPGLTLALQVVPTNLAAMIQCFEWKVDGAVSMEEKPAMTLPRAHPLICVPVPRFSLPF